MIDLSTVADRIVSSSAAAGTVREVHEAGPNDTFVDFEESEFGLDWTKADLGEWRPIAVEYKKDVGVNTYRVWFRPE